MSDKKYRQVQVSEQIAQKLDRLKALSWVVKNKKQSVSEVLEDLVNDEINRLETKVKE